MRIGIDLSLSACSNQSNPIPAQIDFLDCDYDSSKNRVIPESIPIPELEWSITDFLYLNGMMGL